MTEDMSASETLAEEELVAITGYKKPASQRTWLDRNGWKYFKNRTGHPIVGRAYARMRLSGLNTAAQGKAAPEPWSLDLSKVG